MGILVYGSPFSPPCRVVTVTLEVLGLEWEYKNIDLFAGENKTEEYLKLNPQHNIPFLVDGDVKLNESRAIAVYLAQKYGKGKGYFPECPDEQAIVLQRLFFDGGVLWKKFFDVFGANTFNGVKGVSDDGRKNLEEAFGWFENFLKPTGFVAGTKAMTVADFSALATLSSIEKTEKNYIDLSKYPAVTAWLEKMKAAVPNYARANGEGAEAFRNMFKERTGLIQ